MPSTTSKTTQPRPSEGPTAQRPPARRVTPGASTGTASRGYAKGRAKRDEILEAATGLFGEVGYHSASLREISSRVGISHPGLLHHFPTKEVLLQAVLEHRDTVDFALLEADLEQGLDYFDALVRVVERNAARPGIVELFCILSAEATAPDHPAHHYFQRRYDEVLQRSRQELARRAARGQLRAGADVAATARAIVALMDGLQVQFLLERDGPRPPVDMAAGLRSYLSLILPDATAGSTEPAGETADGTDPSR
ncbi:TetR/AcrR family transcriptional regulator [Oerskovia turbata]|uniref:TetR/AcrR family transcriptional regulator n=1 Tax=Oerskovia turbata TaxID=1713 RepID=A0A4Q1KVI6_9CELL|nr:TetR/AcrR family transcriptional regulator [Oerskovia turbata]RXR25708.1 TetR/AcrR family transcriptional regulator [Oerskovia turbata]RXR33204.1 TetR/AcrR family transcriptional regulator [Oerskovia turbata]TGJ96276.1 TetR/AcrR family transcriptional regulator [Actinotalea fermentans ATCC 43279 = JCM 9966 = DSM 3133]